MSDVKKCFWHTICFPSPFRISCFGRNYKLSRTVLILTDFPLLLGHEDQLCSKQMTSGCLRTQITPASRKWCSWLQTAQVHPLKFTLAWWQGRLGWLFLMFRLCIFVLFPRRILMMTVVSAGLTLSAELWCNSELSESWVSSGGFCKLLSSGVVLNMPFRKGSVSNRLNSGYSALSQRQQHFSRALRDNLWVSAFYWFL